MDSTEELSLHRHIGRRLGRDETDPLPWNCFISIVGESSESRGADLSWTTRYHFKTSWRKADFCLFCHLVDFPRTWSFSVLLSGVLMKNLKLVCFVVLYTYEELEACLFCWLAHFWRTWSLSVFVVRCTYEELEACLFLLSGALMRTSSLHYDSHRTLRKAEKIVVQICCSLSSYAVLKMPTSFFPHWRRQFD